MPKSVNRDVLLAVVQAYQAACMAIVTRYVAILPNLNTRLTAQYEIHVATRIGIHTRQVVAGDMGGHMRTEQLAVGAAPNIAARILALAGSDSVPSVTQPIAWCRVTLSVRNLGRTS